MQRVYPWGNSVMKFATQSWRNTVREPAVTFRAKLLG
jgi:hypothetical protein